MYKPNSMKELQLTETSGCDPITMNPLHTSLMETLTDTKLNTKCQPPPYRVSWFWKWQVMFGCELRSTGWKLCVTPPPLSALLTTSTEKPGSTTCQKGDYSSVLFDWGVQSELQRTGAAVQEDNCHHDGSDDDSNRWRGQTMRTIVSTVIMMILMERGVRGAGRAAVTCRKRPPVWKSLQGEAFPSISRWVAWLVGWSISWVGKPEGAGVSTAGTEEEEEEED